MNRARNRLVALGLLAWAASAAAVAVRDPQPKPALRAHPPGSAVRFEINHTGNGKAGPLTSPDGKLTVKVVGALEAVIVETGSNRPAGPVLRHSQRRDSMRLHTWAFSPNGRLLATASSEGKGEDTVGEVRVWEVATGKLLKVATDGKYDLGRVRTLAFSADSSAVLIHCQEISGK